MLEHFASCSVHAPSTHTRTAHLTCNGTLIEIRIRLRSPTSACRAHKTCDVRTCCRVPNAASDELDEMEYESVEPLHKTAERAAAERDACRAVSTALLPKLRSVLEQVLNELKDK